jgi:hypothetical protein
LGDGNDRLILNAGGTVTVVNVETVGGGTGIDNITLTAPYLGTIDLGSNNDMLTLASSGNTITAINVETLVGGAGDDIITLGGSGSAGKFDLGAGDDILTLSPLGGSVTLTNVETLSAGSGNDFVVMTTSYNGNIDLGLGNDKLTLANAGHNTVTIVNIETIVAGSAGDVIALASNSKGAIIIGGLNGDTIFAGTGADIISLASGTASDSIVYTATNQSPHGAGADSITNFGSTDKIFFTGLLSGGTASFATGNGFSGFTATAGNHSQVYFDNTSHILHIDTTGTGVESMTITLTGVSGTALSTANFVWS